MTSRLLRAQSVILLALATASLGACTAADRLANVGRAPNLSAIEDPTAQPGYKPVRMPMPDAAPVSYASNSLWRQGSRAFFKDQRAAQVGDIMTVRVRVTDRAQLDNQTKRSRTNDESLSAENMFGFETQYGKLLPDDARADALLNAASNSSSQGAGSVRRSEQLVTNVAAVVTQVLPNGNLVIEGK